MPDLTHRFLRGLRATLRTSGPRSRTLLLSHTLVDPGLALWNAEPDETARVAASPATPPPSEISPSEIPGAPRGIQLKACWSDEDAADAVAGVSRG
ncbi:hypothetical protein [Nocardia yamanashiensis]|uniref:hypothetical protein n=1 Tax=Nocardia yamanashiensis TaxID=209247 RepID=UPI0008328C84|nr:hypothetical protein [Nocardia yamanashiensis]